MTATVAIVAAHDEDRGIGRGGDIPWRIPADFALFRRLTLGHVLVMGRATLESLPSGGLPGRRIVCVGRRPSLPGAVLCRPGLGEALEAARDLAGEEGRVFAAGGSRLYEEAADIADEAYVTEVPGRHGCDRFFPDLASKGWRRAEAIPLEGAAAWRWTPVRG